MSPRRKRLLEDTPEAAAAAAAPPPAFQVGAGVKAAMDYLKDRPLTDEVYSKAPDGTVYSDTEGLRHRYRWSAETDVLVYEGKRPDQIILAPPGPPPSLPPFLAALDVSSHQGLDISRWIDELEPIDHVITKLYQGIELGGNGGRYSIAQAQTARSKGCTVGGYVWLYAGFDGARQVASALDTATAAKVVFSRNNPLWLDCEDYQEQGGPKTWPSVEIIGQAVDECRRRSVPVGIYTGGWWWIPKTNNSTLFRALPLWAAVYDGSPNMVNVGFGGWTVLAGKQWTSKPVDRNTFRSQF